MLNGKAAEAASPVHSTFNIEHSTFNISPLNMVNPQNRHHDRHECTRTDDRGAPRAIGVADVRLQHDGEKDPRDDGADLFHAQVHQFRGRAIRPEDAGENAEGVEAESNREGAVADGLADVEARNPIPQRAAVLCFESPVLRPREHAEGESDEQSRNSYCRKKYMRDK